MGMIGSEIPPYLSMTNLMGREYEGKDEHGSAVCSGACRRHATAGKLHPLKMTFLILEQKQLYWGFFPFFTSYLR